MNTPITWMYPQGKRRAVTFSYDDGQVHDRRVVATLNKYGMKGTFNLCSSLILDNAGKDHFVDADEVCELYKGHEVAVHSAHHPFLERLTPYQVLMEVLEDRRQLEKWVGYPIIGMAYPYGTWDNMVLEQVKAAGIRYSRTTENTPNFHLPLNWLTWHSTCHHANAMSKMEAFLNSVSPMNLFYIWGHSFEFDRNGNWELLDQICSALPKDETTWYATNGEIYRYVEAMRQLVLDVELHQVFNPTAQEIWYARDGEIHSVKPGALQEL